MLEHHNMVQDTECIQTGQGTGRSEPVKCEKHFEVCEGCGQKIYDKWLMSMAGTSWHEDCLTCCICRAPLTRSCYCRDAKIYCKEDYDRIFAAKCARCGERLLPHELVMRAEPHIYHLHCFVCVVCCHQLRKGDEFVIRGGQLFCRADFEKELFMLQQASPRDDLILDENSRPRDGRRGPKRPRTILTSGQRRQFKASFEISPKPCRKVREALAKETGLSVRVVQVWFQNQRAKMKKLQRKAKQEADQKNCDKDGKEGKEEKPIKQEPQSTEQNHYLGLNSLNSRELNDSAYTPSSSQPLNPNIPFSPDDTYPTHSGESFCSSELSLDGSTNFEQLDESGQDSMTQQSMDRLQQPTDTYSSSAIEQVNHIDKLYLMSNTYLL